MSRIVIHAGFHKTSTSTLQAGLDAARGPLRPHAKIVPARGMQALLHACRACSTLPEPLSPAKVAAGLPHPVHRPPLEATPDPRAALLRLAGVPEAARAALPPLRHRNAARPAALDDLLHINRTISDRAARRDAKTARPRQATGTR